jgi:hypothetical protein
MGCTPITAKKVTMPTAKLKSRISEIQNSISPTNLPLNAAENKTTSIE